MAKTQILNTRYHATFELDESGNWIAEIDELPQVHTFGRTLGKAREYLVDALALWLNVPIDDAKGAIDFRAVALPEQVQSSVDQAIASRAIAEVAAENAGAMMSDAALALTKVARLSYRDAGELLGISHQRVQQLVSEVRGGNPLTSSGTQGVAQDIAHNLKEILPGARERTWVRW
ncbi:MAG TPA: type II toxin-antitoxin system HicB family antitoxin [Acidimicrobiales bacterium]|nr:type II toxin-antitoxin system HicB family antitoxin [Acidimicrobiales bacterium]